MRLRRAHVLFWLLLIGCAAPGHARRDRLYEGAFLPPPPIEAPAPVGVQEADDGLTGVRKPPVFGEQERPPVREPPVKPKVRLGKVGEEALKKIVWGATLRRECPDCEEHHLFPRQEGLRQLFVGSGIDVDEWAILLPREVHRAVHREQEDYGAGGKWNWDWANWWKPRIKLKTSADEIFVHALEMIREYKLTDYGLPIQYGYGRSISRDLYDIVRPPRDLP